MSADVQSAITFGGPLDGRWTSGRGPVVLALVPPVLRFDPDPSPTASELKTLTYRLTEFGWRSAPGGPPTFAWAWVLDDGGKTRQWVVDVLEFLSAFDGGAGARAADHRAREDAGYSAALAGDDVGACPWRVDDPHGAAWRLGWLRGESARRQLAGTFGAGGPVHTSEFALLPDRMAPVDELDRLQREIPDPGVYRVQIDLAEMARGLDDEFLAAVRNALDRNQ